MRARLHRWAPACTLACFAALCAIALGATPPPPIPHSTRPARHARCSRSSRRRHRPRGARCRHVHRHPSAQHPAPGQSAPVPGAGTSPAAPGAPAGQPGASAGTSTAPVPEGAQTGTGSTPPPSLPHVQVTAVEYSFTLSRTTVPAGKVVLQFVNHGQDEHNLNAAPQEGPLAGHIADTPAGGVVDEEVELRPGTYTLFCSLPEHAKKGMKATLTVE
jgi:plastocyanin